MLLALASVTDSLVTLATHVIRDLGLAGVALMTFTTGIVGLPGTEPTMLFAGFNVYDHHLTLVGIISLGLIGDVLGACVAYAIGYFASRELLEHQGTGRYLSPHGLDRAQRWFERRGAVALLVSRVIPLVRLAFPYAAGVAKMRFERFLAMVVLGSIVWITGLGVLGREVGSNWSSWRKHLEVVDYVVLAAAVIGIAYLVIRRVRRAPVDVVSE